MPKKIIRTLIGLPIILIGYLAFFIIATVLFIAWCVNDNEDAQSTFIVLFTLPYTWLKEVWS